MKLKDIPAIIVAIWASLFALFLLKNNKKEQTDIKEQVKSSPQKAPASSHRQTSHTSKKQSKRTQTANRESSQQKVQRNCYTCSGRGYFDRCDSCEGEGEIWFSAHGEMHAKRCSICNGTGGPIACNSCDGSGKDRFG